MKNSALATPTNMSQTRVGRLRERIINAPQEICVERARYLTHSMKDNWDSGPLTRMSMALEHILANISIAIREDELIVGCRTSKLKGAPLYPESKIRWIGIDVDSFDQREVQRALITENEKNEIIADICRRVTEHPARTFHEAVQSFYFIHLIAQIESGGNSVSLGRIDRILEPYYKKDIENNAIIPQQARELVSLLFIKTNEIWNALEEAYIPGGEGTEGKTTQNVVVGGFTIKIVQGGQAAGAGILAAGLAGKGLTGTPQVLEGSDLNGGFTKITSAAEPKFDKLSDGLGKSFSISDVYFKPYTACRHTHGAAQACLELSSQEDFSIDDISEITVYTYGIAELAVGKGVKINDSFVSAQFSIPYVVAACLTDGKLGPSQLTEKRMADENLFSLSGKVTVKTDDALNQLYPEKTSSRIEIKIGNNRLLKKQIDIPKGDPRDPMTEADIIEKLKQYAGKRETDKIERVIAKVLHLEDLNDMSELTCLI